MLNKLSKEMQGTHTGAMDPNSDWSKFVLSHKGFTLKDIQVDQIPTAVKSDGMSQDNIEKYKQADTSQFPPMVIGNNGYLLDGNHRLQAYKAQGIKTVKAYVGEEVEVSLHGDAKKGYVLSKIEVSGDERNAGQGTKAMQDIVDRMDREGAIIALTPDDAFGGNKNRLIKFYKRFGFVPNKGRNKDFRFRETMIRYPQTSESVNEGYKLQLERDADMMVLNITDTETGKRTEVRGKSGYESGNYDANDKLHQLLDRIGKASNISELINGEVVGINPKHPDGKNAKTATDTAFNAAKDGLPAKTLKGLYHVGTLEASKKRDGYEGAGLSVSTHPDAWKQIARGHVTGDTHSATKEGNKFLDAHGLSDAHNEQIKQWALENDYLAQQETVTVCYYDDEMEDDLCSTFNSMADAEAEYDEELEHMDVSVDKGGIVPTDKLKKETRQNRIDSTGVLEFVLPIFAEQQGLDGVWWQDKLDVQRYSAPRGVIVPSKIKSWKFAVNETKAFNESLDNPYPYTWDASHDRYAELGNDSFLAKADMDMGELMVLFTMGRPGRSWTIDFAVDGTMQKTGDGDQFRTFATVVAVIKDWVANKVDLEKVTQIDFSSDKMGSTEEDSRGKLYKRFGQQLASKLGWTLEIKDRGHFADFKIKNPNAPVEESAGVGRVVKGVNTTVDVGVDEIIKQVKKFGNDVNRDGIPTKNLRTK